MKNPQEIAVLHLEDDPNDALLISRFLEREGIPCSITVTDTKETFETALRERNFDVILSDFTIPGYNGETALRAARNLRPEIPFLFVSGTIGEDKAVEALHSGATDYVLKERLDRLGTALKRALRESSERTLRRRAEADRKELEERLRQSQKMEAVGQLAGGIAHDFNNLLVVLQGNSELLLLTEDGISLEGKECLKQMLATCQRASNLTRQLLTFSRKQPMAPKALDLNSILPGMLQMLRRVLDSRIRVTCDFENGLPSVYGDQGMLEQVLMNLVLNARDAMPGGGELAITTSAECVQKEELKHPDARVGPFVCLAVRDTGSGIAPENLVRIFEPFFTTKQLGSGTGLGLATVYGIVKQHDGWVAVESKPGKGSAFRVYLPVRGSAVPVTGPAAQRSHSVPMGTEKILVAEDDDAVRQITARILVGLGYTVLEAASGKAAMEIWRTSKGDFDLLLSDVLMTDGLTGDALAVSLRGAKPQLKVLLTSGYGPIPKALENDEVQKRNFLPKPYSSSELAQAVRRCLDEH